MPRFRDGRMLYPRWHRRRDQMHPRLFSGRRPRRWAHARFGTQTNPYGAAGGGRRQFHAGMSGAAGRVYSHMLAQARGGQGFNYGLLPSTPGYRGTRMHRGFRQDQASIRKHFRGRIQRERRNLRNAATDKERDAIRGRISDLRGQHRSERRAHAQGIHTKWAGGHDFNLGGGRRRQWRPNQTTGGRRLSRRHILSPRIGINVGQNPYTGRRFIQGMNFRRQQGGGLAGYNRALRRNMRRPNPAAYADFTLGGRRRGWIGRGDHWNTGPNAGTVLRPRTFPASSNMQGTRSRRRPMTPYEIWIAQGRHAPHAREFARSGVSRLLPSSVSEINPFLQERFINYAQ